MAPSHLHLSSINIHHNFNTTTMGSGGYKNVIVIGAGQAGKSSQNLNLPQSLEAHDHKLYSFSASGVIESLIQKLPSTHRVISICEKEYAYWPIGALRAAVIPGWEDQVVIPLKGWLKAPHVLLAGVKVLNVEYAQKMVVLDKETKLGIEIDYDFLIIATVSGC
jgi:hypothetical protein